MPERKIEVPDAVEVKAVGKVLVVKGPKGELRREFRHPQVKLSVKGKEVSLSSESERRKVKALLGTWEAHLNNMVKGVHHGWQCELKLLYSHFPVKLKLEGNELLIENFLGERKPRVAKIIQGAEVNLEKDVVRVSGPDKEVVGQTAARIEQAAKVTGQDRRVFQDGIHMVSKPHVIEEAGSDERKEESTQAQEKGESQEA